MRTPFLPTARRLFPTLAAACLIGACAAAGAATTETPSPPPFGHYQPILDRMPFGALPPNFGQAVDAAAAQTTAQAQAEQQKLAKQVNMSAVNITPDGQTAIGFTDLSAKPPVNHYLLVGASADGWTVVSADYDDEIATLEKEGVTITLQLGKGLIDPAALTPKTAGPALPPSAASPAAPARPSAVPPPLLSRRSAPSALPLRSAAALTTPAGNAPAEGAGDEVRSYKERLIERKTQQTEAEKAAARQQQEQLLKLAREAAQKEIARQTQEAAQAAAENAEEPVTDAQLRQAAPEDNQE